ncbi:hypothetical protein PAXRUDRAFT_177818, partial [Paxillus rubicundulus Ve08.2h10]
ANHEAADTSNPNTTCAGTTKPAGTSYGLLNVNKEVKGRGGEGERDERASGSVAPTWNDENAAPNLIPPPPNPDKCVLLEGEKTGQQSSGRPEETTMHLAQHKWTQRRTPCVGQTARSKAKKGGKGKRHERVSGSVAPSLDDKCCTQLDTTSHVPHPECRRNPEHTARGGVKCPEAHERHAHRPTAQHKCDNDDATKAYTMAAQRHADTMHNPGGSTHSPGSQPLSV